MRLLVSAAVFSGFDDRESLVKSHATRLCCFKMDGVTHPVCHMPCRWEQKDSSTRTVISAVSAGAPATQETLEPGDPDMQDFENFRAVELCVSEELLTEYREGIARPN